MATTTIDCNSAHDNSVPGTIAEQIAHAVCTFQHNTTGHKPRAVTVVLSEDTLVITLHEALTPAERQLSLSESGASKVQEFYRQLFATSSDQLRAQIESITGRSVRESTTQVEPASGAIVHAFTSGTLVQVFLLKPNNSAPLTTG